MAGAVRLLAINPNTSAEVTEAFVAAARRCAPDGVRIDGVTGRFGARTISTEAETVIAGHAALDLAASHAAGCDAVILAISFDTALRALREVLPVPVVGITEAALAAAGDRPVGVVLFGAVSEPLYERLIAGYGATPVGFEAIEIASAADYLSPAAKDRAVADACNRLAARGAEAVVICGAAIVGMAARLAGAVKVPVFDGSAAVALALQAVQAAAPIRRMRPLGGSTGLSPALAALLAGGTVAPPA
jgi:allantoin racemase